MSLIVKGRKYNQVKVMLIYFLSADFLIFPFLFLMSYTFTLEFQLKKSMTRERRVVLKSLHEALVGS